MLFVGSMGQAAVLEHPQPGSVQSGISMLSGWKCEAGTITVRFDGGPPMPIPHGSPREDTLRWCQWNKLIFTLQEIFMQLLLLIIFYLH